MRFAVTEELRDFNSYAPATLGGSPVVLQLTVHDAEKSSAAMCRAGGTMVFPVQALLGERMARVRDPFGHLWLLRQPIEQLSHQEIQERRDALYAAASAHAKTRSNLQAEGARGQDSNAGPHIDLVVGPVGAGKSTYACALARKHGALRLTLDEWMRILFRPDRPDEGLMHWYAERAQRCVDVIWEIARELVEQGGHVVLEIGLLRRQERDAFYQRVESAGVGLTIHVLDAARQVRRARVAERNRRQGETFSMVVPDDVFELASDLWQAPEPEECLGRDVRFVRTD
jgi:predicted kinase